jgi:hypothetical protein
MARSVSAISSVGIVELQIVGDDIAIGHVGAEVDVEGNRGIDGAATLLAEDGERAGIVGAQE